MSAKTGRVVVLFGQPYEWVRRTGTKSGTRKRPVGQLLLRRIRSKEYQLAGDHQPSSMLALVAPCADRIARPVPGYVGP